MKCKNAEEEEKEIVQEIVCDVNKHFNSDNNVCTNQQLIVHKDLFRGVIVNKLAMLNEKRMILKCAIKQ